MRVERQNAWPSVDRDIHGWLNTLSFMMPPGFYYKIFHKPRFLWPLVEPIIRRAAGLGKVPREEDHTHLQKVHLHPEVLVVGVCDDCSRNPAPRPSRRRVIDPHHRH